MNTLTLDQLDALFCVGSIDSCGCRAGDGQTLSGLMKLGLVELASEADPLASPPYHITQAGRRVLRAVTEFAADRLW